MEYQKLTVWQESFKLIVSIHKGLKGCRNFGLKDQITRSAVFISSNIAEGGERETKKESVRFLCYAKGSCGELVTQLMLAGLIKYRSGSVKEPSATYGNGE